MNGTSVSTSRELTQDIASIDDERVLNVGHVDPGVLVEELEPRDTIMENDREESPVGVRRAAKMSLVGEGMGEVMEEPQERYGLTLMNGRSISNGTVSLLLHNLQSKCHRLSYFDLMMKCIL